MAFTNLIGPICLFLVLVCIFLLPQSLFSVSLSRLADLTVIEFLFLLREWKTWRKLFCGFFPVCVEKAIGFTVRKSPVCPFTVSVSASVTKNFLTSQLTPSNSRPFGKSHKNFSLFQLLRLERLQKKSPPKNLIFFLRQRKRSRFLYWLLKYIFLSLPNLDTLWSLAEAEIAKSV